MSSVRISRVLGSLSALALSVGLLSAAPSVTAAAPPGSSRTFAAIGFLPIGVASTDVYIAGETTVTTADDTIFVGTDDSVFVFPPLAASGTVGGQISVSDVVESMTSNDDTLYIAQGDFGPGVIQAIDIDASSGTPPVSVALTERPNQIAAGGRGTIATDDDTIYLVGRDDSVVVQWTPTLDDSATTRINEPAMQPGVVTVSGGSTASIADDTVYVGGSRIGPDDIIQLTPSLDDSFNIASEISPGPMTILDDSLYFPSISGVRAVNLLENDDSAVFPLYSLDLAINAAGDLGAIYYNYPVPSQDSPLVILGANALDFQAQLNLGPVQAGKASIAAASDGTFYFGTGRNDIVNIIDRVDAGTMAPAAGGPGDTVSLPFTTASGRLADDSTVTAVWWGDVSVPFSRIAGQNRVEVVAPEFNGTVEVVIEVRGGEGLSLGSFVGPSAPQPATPAGPPLDVAATGVDRAIDVTWAAPDSSGSFPVTYYQGQVEGSSRQCLVPATSEREQMCRIAPVVNGEEYRVRVRALTGAGWGAWSDAVTVVPGPPPPPPPAPSIVITGARDGRSVTVEGVTTGLVGEQVTPWVRFPGPHRYKAGTGVKTVSADGTFTWQRETRKKVYVYFRTGEVRSNRVIIR